MRIIAALFIVCGFFCCRKNETMVNRVAERTDFFKDSIHALKKVQGYLNLFAKKETVSSIQSVSYIDSKDKSYAFVFYTSDKGENNIVIRQDYKGSDLIGGGSVKCEGEHCSCRVKTLITREGDVVLDCTCTSCTMLLN
jgi:hypothetical protein